MASSAKQTVLIIRPETAEPGDVAAVLEGAARLALQHRAATSHDGPAELSPDLVIADFDEVAQPELDLLESLRGEFRSVPMIVVSNELGDDQVRRLFRLQISDWLRKPLDKDALMEAVSAAVAVTKTTGNPVHAVISSIGGAGATTVAVSMADLLVNRLTTGDAPIAVFDLDFSLGDVGLGLNMVNDYRLGSVVDHPNRIDREFINLIQRQHDAEFFIYSFKEPDLPIHPGGEELVLRMLDVVSAEHRHTVLDMPYYEAPWTEEVLSAVNTCTVVTELNLPAVKHALDWVKRIRRSRGEDFPLHVVINKHQRSMFGQRIKKKKLKELFDPTPFTYLPEDERTLDESLDRGILPRQLYSRSPFVKRLERFMRDIDILGAKS
ncbi:hypothetical protein ACQ5SP_14785 [Rhodovulum sp. YNF3179]|uniref:hypothetical protein n=1 Tax=Rhodovulum sp. YNF3179 TaxID=3425127 RepID=UPI003D352873